MARPWEDGGDGDGGEEEDRRGGRKYVYTEKQAKAHRGERVIVIGAGIAGLAAACELIGVKASTPFSLFSIFSIFSMFALS